MGFLGWVRFNPKPNFFYGFFIFEIHIYPLVRPNPLFWVGLDGFNRIEWVCPIHVHPYLKYFYINFVSDLVGLYFERVEYYFAFALLNESIQFNVVIYL
jgi:hypothetical protein